VDQVRFRIVDADDEVRLMDRFHGSCRPRAR
jgi:hypothetical protein